MQEKQELNIELLTKFFQELQNAIKSAEEIREGVDFSNPKNYGTYKDFIVEYSKVVGILTYMSREASELIKDVQGVLQTAVKLPSSSDVMDFNSILGGYGSSGGNNRGN